MAKKKPQYSFPTVILSEVADTLRIPPALKDEEIKKGGKRVNVLFLNDIPSAGFIENASNTITFSKDSFQKYSKYMLQPYDVILSIAGTIGNVAVMPEEFRGNWTATNTLLTVRFHENQKDNAMALAMFLKSPYGEEALDKVATGGTISRVNVKDVNTLEIPELTSEVKKASKAACNKEIKLYEKINDYERQIIEDVRGSYLRSAASR